MKQVTFFMLEKMNKVATYFSDQFKNQSFRRSGNDQGDFLSQQVFSFSKITLFTSFEKNTKPNNQKQVPQGKTKNVKKGEQL